ncbi:hypothetical protein D3874_22155 [Oleomonas cavernae]|uniref:Uncharacterized protein n=1 Tax=Oleomonas cavernae TaxID=2320859 RepID=A0A418WH19_9PROT|nr:hypothetical protein [Oleomonas cavernae]RJF89341.1 hypothetical protein D3874_22155 [Oleomonas cavernae]
MIFGYLRRRRAFRSAVQAEVAQLVEEHGQFAYSAALAAFREARGREAFRFWAAVRAAVAKRDGRRIGLDASDRWPSRP